MVRVRYAPSPTGSPHVGNIRTALFNWIFARHHGGKFIVRIEDTDQNRYVPGSEEDILLSLRWLGIDWDEGPEVGGPHAPYHQSQRLATYQQIAHQLVEQGKAYKCFCTPEELEQMRAEQKRMGAAATMYDRRCRKLTPAEVKAREADGLPYVIRFAMPLEGTVEYDDLIHGRTEFRNALTDDFVMLKSDGFPTYHLANVVDDHLMEITHVIRGDEWISSMPRHLNLYRALGWETPQFAHLPLLLGADKQKLSKRHGSVQFVEFVREGYLPDAMFNFLALCGWNPGDDREILSREEIVREFSLERVSDNPFVFHHDKLLWMNGHYLRELPKERLIELTLPYLQEAGLLPKELTPELRAYAERVIPLEQEKMKLLSDVVSLTDFFFTDHLKIDEKAVRKWYSEPHIPQMLEELVRRFEALEPFDTPHIEQVVRGVAEWLGVKAAEVIHPVRVALSGRTTGPSLFEMIEVLGKPRVIQRLRNAQSWIPR
ncbi:MAG: glutamate--tRNA ligase [Fimbriimonadales bacterium]